jgi:DUF4097 and DUF4098 domain-containing protein YvlB
MQPITAPGTAPRPADLPPGRWIWRLAGIATVLTCASLLSYSTVRAGTADFGQYQQSALPMRTVVVNGEVSSLTVNSYGSLVRVSRGSVNQVTVTETIGFDPSVGRPAVQARVNHGDLTLDAPSCQHGGCTVGFAVIVPASFPGVTVSASSDGGPVSVSGVAAANIDSGSGPVNASDVQGLLTVTSEGGDITASGLGSASLDSGSGNVSASGIPGTLNIISEGGSIDVHGTGSATLDSGSGQVNASAVLGTLAVTSAGGSVHVAGARGVTVDSGSGGVDVRSVNGPLSATTSGGPLEIDGLTGPLIADTGSGPFNARGITSATARVTTDGGSAWMSFTKAPQSVQVTTASGDAVLVLPGGPYQVSDESGGGPVDVSVPVSPVAAHLIVISTGGGELQVKPPAGS